MNKICNLLEYLFLKQMMIVIIYFCNLSLSGCYAGDKIKEINASKIIKQINNKSPINYKNIKIIDDFDMTQIIVNTKKIRGLNIIIVDVPIIFEECTFNDKIKTYSKENDIEILIQFNREIIFHNCKFKNDVLFRESTFFCKVDFAKSEFEKKCNFENTTFSSYNTDFDSCKFQGEVNFSKSIFSGKVDFFNSEFESVVKFQKAVFYNEFQFSNSIFKKNVDFSGSKYFDQVNFNYSKFYQKILLNNNSYIQHF